ncbi:MAG: long-chain fatty acid transport protein [Planctomycetaceae bacterium]|jgi:long-chain fatty acid transport protein
MQWSTQALSLACAVTFILVTSNVQAQTFGVELHNNLMPASGGMAGVSLSRPQDLQSAINGNPATLRQFEGTQFSFGGGFIDANYNVSQTSNLPLLGVTPFSGRSNTLPGLLGNIGLTQQLDAFGLPATVAMGLITNAGAGVDFRHVPASNGTSAQYLALDMVAAAGVDLTEQLSFGSSFALGTSYFDGPFVDIGGMTAAYGVRFSAGANYQLTPETSLGAYWQSKKNLEFENAALPAGGTPVDIAFDHPMNVGFGVANTSLMDGRLLLAADAIYKRYSDADTLKAIFTDQWAVQIGGQYAATDRIRLRLGYAWNENPMKAAQLESIGGINLADGVPAVRYVQGQFAAITQHRITAGVGVQDMLPGIDVNLFAGKSFDADDQLGATSVRIDSNYWVGFGTTWRFGGGRTCCTSDGNN